MKNLKKNKKGFTLIEMIVVIVIIAILAAIAVPAVMKYIDEARETKLITHASSAKTSLEAELAKAQAKSTSGKFKADTALKAAVDAVAKDVTDVESVDFCTDIDNTGTKPTCVPMATASGAEGKLDDIKGYIIGIGGKYVAIVNDGSSEIFTESYDNAKPITPTK